MKPPHFIFIACIGMVIAIIAAFIIGEETGPIVSVNDEGETVTVKGERPAGRRGRRRRR